MDKTTEQLTAEDIDNGVPEDLLPCEPDSHVEPFDQATEVGDPTTADAP